MEVNEDLAIPKVRQFWDLVVALDDLYAASGDYLDTGYYKTTKAQVDLRVPLIKSIAEASDPTIPERIEDGLRGHYGYSRAVTAVTELLGILEGAEERAAIFSPKGPKLSAASMHPWVWGVAASLWGGGPHPQAVQTAASSIFDANLPTKLGLPKGAKGTKPEEMVAKAFDENAPILTIPGLIHPGSDGGSGYWIPTSCWSVCWAA